jgi:hypothetical protein
VLVHLLFCWNIWINEWKQSSNKGFCVWTWRTRMEKEFLILVYQASVGNINNNNWYSEIQPDTRRHQLKFPNARCRWSKTTYAGKVEYEKPVKIVKMRNWFRGLPSWPATWAAYIHMHIHMHTRKHACNVFNSIIGEGGYAKKDWFCHTVIHTNDLGFESRKIFKRQRQRGWLLKPQKSAFFFLMNLKMNSR